MAYRLDITGTARRRFRTLSETMKPRIAGAIGRLADTPRPVGCKKLKADLGWSYPVGDYRIIYTIDDKAQVVTILWVGPRGAAYKGN